MLDRAVQRELVRYLETMRTASVSGKQSTQALSLEKVRETCQKGLPPSRYAYYKEVLEGASTALSRETPDFLALGQELLRSLAEELRREREVKKDIVFLPYKKSMWDSLESVWKAASEDAEHCNAYVMPIPYYDRNPDKSLGEMHCERDLFPKDVPTLNWEDVDLAAWHPDAIFIHSPYDGMNNVTCVKETYWSENLRKCTDKLVYIPYYVSAEPDTENAGSMDAIAPFALVPGVLNADMVIVQSEAVKEAFVRALLDRTNCKDRSYWEKRILGIGSPKFDKIFNEQKAAFDLPQEWRKIIKGKKTILYNTSLNVTLQHADSFCNKLRYVMDTFRNRDDVALWWRPHPLMEASLKAMRPGILGEYKAIVEQYRSEGWGIFDDSAELERAIVCTDAYYGDASSVVELYRRTGKPMMVQNIAVSLCNKGEVSFHARCICETDFGAWFIHRDIAILFFFDYQSQCITLQKILPIDDIYADTPFYSIAIYGDELFLLPFNESNVFIYSIDKDEFQTIPVVQPCKRMFVMGFASGKYVYGIPMQYDRVIKIHAETHEIIYCDSWKSLLDKGSWLINAACEGESGRTLAVIWHKPLILLFDVKTEKWKIVYREEKGSFIKLCVSGAFVYVYDEARKCIKKIDTNQWELVNEKSVKYSDVRMIGLRAGWFLADAIDSADWYIYDSNLDVRFHGALKESAIDSYGRNVLYACWNRKGNGLICIDNASNLWKSGKGHRAVSFPLKLTKKARDEIEHEIRDSIHFVMAYESGFFRLDNGVLSILWKKAENRQMGRMVNGINIYNAFMDRRLGMDDT